MTEKAAFVAGLPPRVAHAVHGLLVASSEFPPKPCSASEVCIYDAHWEALSGRHTGAALREASKLGLCFHAGPYWVATNLALDHKQAFETRFLRDEDAS